MPRVAKKAVVTKRAAAGKGKVSSGVSAKRQTTILRDMRVFHRMTDWAGLWEEWYLSIKADGSFKYRTLRDFIAGHSKNKAQRLFMKWYLGPDHDGENDCPYGLAIRPLGWLEKRRSGGWFTPDNLQKFSREINRRVNALDALREAGAITVHSLVRAENMAQQIDRAFGGAMFSEELDFTQNIHRADWYIKLQSKVLGLKARAQDLFAKSHGVNFDDMSGLVALMTASALTAQTKDSAQSREEAALTAVVRMAMAKSAQFKLDLPPGSVEVITGELQSVNKKKLN